MIHQVYATIHFQLDDDLYLTQGPVDQLPSGKVDPALAVWLRLKAVGSNVDGLENLKVEVESD